MLFDTTFIGSVFSQQFGFILELFRFVFQHVSCSWCFPFRTYLFFNNFSFIFLFFYFYKLFRRFTLYTFTSFWLFLLFLLIQLLGFFLGSVFAFYYLYIVSLLLFYLFFCNLIFLKFVYKYYIFLLSKAFETPYFEDNHVWEPLVAMILKSL